MGAAGEQAVIDGVKGEWRVDPSYLDGSPFEVRAALLSPFDRLVHDREQAEEIFEYQYQLEMYKPAAKRLWGYFALPILFGDRLVGKLGAKADRKVGVALAVERQPEIAGLMEDRRRTTSRPSRRGSAIQPTKRTKPQENQQVSGLCTVLAFYR